MTRSDSVIYINLSNLATECHIASVMVLWTRGARGATFKHSLDGDDGALHFKVHGDCFRLVFRIVPLRAPLNGAKIVPKNPV